MAQTRFNRRTLPGATRLDRSNPWAFVGDVLGTKMHQRRPGSLLIPLDADPDLWRYPVADLEITLVSEVGSRNFANRVAAMLIADGARLVAACDPESPARIFKR